MTSHGNNLVLNSCFVDNPPVTVAKFFKDTSDDLLIVTVSRCPAMHREQNKVDMITERLGIIEVESEPFPIVDYHVGKQSLRKSGRNP